MNRKNILRMVAVSAIALCAMTSCDKSKPQVDTKQESGQLAPTETKIAYVEVDSIMTQYKFCKDYSLILQKKGQNIQNTLTQKQQQLAAALNNFQEKIQQNAYTREQAQAIQAQLQKQDNDLQALNQRLSSEFQAETDKYNNALRDSIQHYLAVYNKDKKFSLILSKAGDNILYADKAHDITNEVIAGLNKAYKPMPAEKATETEKKK
ncbi:MAG: OmpH family outer membrane protein [Prevotella sp.]